MQVKIIDYHSKNASRDFAAALKEIGFAVIANHPIDHRLIDQGYAAWEDFFKSNDKMNFLFNEETQDGFIPFSKSEMAKGYDTKDLKQFYHYYAWGRCPEALRPITHQLYSELTALAAELLQWLEENTPQEIKKNFSMPLSQMITDSPRTLFRLIHYPPLTGLEDPRAERAAPHEDIDLLTLLPAATAKGLQVKDSSGDWLEVPCNKGWIIVNAGDMLQECSQRYYPSTTHRVVNPTGAEAKMPRLSMPLFFHPRPEVRLSARHTQHSYWLERMKELGLK